MLRSSFSSSCRRAPAVLVAFLALGVAVACRDDAAAPLECTIRDTPDVIALTVGESAPVPTSAPCTGTTRVPVRWATSDAAVAIVDSLTGSVHGLAPGRAILVGATVGVRAAPDTVEVQVSPCLSAVTRVSITPQSLVMPVLGTATLSVRTDYSCGRPSDTTAVWRSTDTTIATVNANGVVKGVRVGTITITAAATTNPSLVASIPLTVSTPGAISGPPVVSPTLLVLEPGATGRYTVHVPITPTAPAGTDTTVTFRSVRSADSCIATVSSDGSITAHDLGSTAIEVIARGDTLLRTAVTVMAFYRGALLPFEPITAGTPPVVVDPNAVRGTINVTVDIIAAPPAGGRLDISLGGRVAATRELSALEVGSGVRAMSFTIETDARDAAGARLYPTGPTFLQATFTHNPPVSRLAGCPIRVAKDVNGLPVTLVNP